MVIRLDSDWAGASVSTGTMRNEDLMPNFVTVLNELGMHWTGLPVSVIEAHDDAEAIIEAASALSEYDREWAAELFNDERAGHVMERLFDALNEIAPEGCSFGSREGDGADYAFNYNECEECGWSPAEPDSHVEWGCMVQDCGVTRSEHGTEHDYEPCSLAEND